MSSLYSGNTHTHHMDDAHFAWSLFHSNNFNSLIIMFKFCLVGHFLLHFSAHLDLFVVRKWTETDTYLNCRRQCCLSCHFISSSSLSSINFAIDCLSCRFVRVA